MLLCEGMGHQEEGGSSHSEQHIPGECGVCVQG